MIIRRKSMATGKVREMDLPITEEQLDRWTRGDLIQDVMPLLTADQREFIISGCTQDEWDDMWSEEHELDDIYRKIAVSHPLIYRHSSWTLKFGLALGRGFSEKEATEYANREISNESRKEDTKPSQPETEGPR